MSSYFRIVIFMCCYRYVTGDMFAKTSENYGPFVAKWNDYGACKAPKAINLANYSTYLLVENNTYKGVMNFSFVSLANVDQVKMTVYSIKDGHKKLLWNYRVDKPCEHYAIAEILEADFGINGCVFKKGNYFWVINFTDCTYKYLGKSFFYGEFVFKLIVLSKKGNIACLFYNPVFTKKS